MKAPFQGRLSCCRDTGVEPANGVLIRPDCDLLAAHPDVYGVGCVGQVRRLAEALVCGPLWAELSSRFGLAVRLDGQPVIGVLGTAQTGDAARLRALGRQVTNAVERLRPVQFPEVVGLCEQLAARLRSQLGPELERAWMVGIPRGGLAVAGLLSYALGTRAAHVGEPPDKSDALLVVVDDCVLSGARLRRWLRDHPHPRVAVACLHATADLCAAVEREEQVVACVAASELSDHAAQQQGIDYARWVTRWRERSPDDYWTGHPDHVVYPWNEPDTVVWNEETGKAEPAWRVVPPDRCMKNRSEMPSDSSGVQTCVAPSGPARPAEGVLWVRAQGSLYVSEPFGGRVTRMAGVAGACWSALMASGDPDAAAEVVAAEYAQPPPRVRIDFDRFIEACQAQGLLVHSGG